MKLEEGIVSQNIGQQNRLMREALGHDKSQRAWKYQIQYAASEDWHDAFCFTEAEFLPQDFEVMNYYTSTHPSLWISKTVTGVKFIREGEELVGKYTLVHNIVRRNIRGNVEVVARCRDEQERVDCLQKYFGIVLDEDEKLAIKGWKAELVHA